MAGWLVLASWLLGAGACAGHRKSPAWPAMAKVDDDHPDGGQSLEPHQSESVAAVESPGGGDAELDALLAAMASDQEAAALATPTPAAPTVSPEEPITTDAIIIEINDDDGDDDGDD